MEKLIDLSVAIEKPFNRVLFSVFQQPIERLLGIDAINGHYSRFRETAEQFQTHRSPFEAILDTLNVRYSHEEARLREIPVSGPLVVVSNHPFGGLDGVILGAMITRIRPDTRILGNYLLKRIEGFDTWIIPVNPFEDRNATENSVGLKHAFRWLKEGGTLIVFPAGEVASWNPKRQAIADPAWSRHVATLIRKTQSAVLPVYFPERNSALFSLAGLVSPRLRTMLLPRELVNKNNRQVSVCVGRPIAWSFLKRKETDDRLIRYLRATTELLRYRPGKNGWSIPGHVVRFVDHRKRHEPLIAPLSAATLRREIEALPEDQLLVSGSEHAVYIAASEQIPTVLTEIGRLREQAFRAVQEGTGRPVDLDRFDSHYRHLFLYNRKTAEIVGGYRLGLVDEILKNHGRNGLYTNTLFRFERTFFDSADCMIEFGRSFVRVEYQKKNNSMIMIWKGIGEFIRRNPRYRMLFGPVSIRNDYQEMSKRLMVRFLMRHHGDPLWSSWVKPRRPYRWESRMPFQGDSLLAEIDTVEDLSHWISQIELDGKGIPTMLKHYLKLNGKILGFNIDGNFSEVIDGLIVVDLATTNPWICKRFVGASET